MFVNYIYFVTMSLKLDEFEQKLQWAQYKLNQDQTQSEQKKYIFIALSLYCKITSRNNPKTPICPISKPMCIISKHSKKQEVFILKCLKKIAYNNIRCVAKIMFYLSYWSCFCERVHKVNTVVHIEPQALRIKRNEFF